MSGRNLNTRVGFKTGSIFVALGLTVGGVFAYAKTSGSMPGETSQPVGDRGSGGAGQGVAEAVAPEGGSFPDTWASGVECANEPPFQVHAYGEDFYIIRQSKCVNYEAPFLFLFVGETRALLMDTGAVPDADVYDTVMEILEDRAGGLESRRVPLVVAHTHSHGDHVSADARFEGAPGVETVVGRSVDDVIDFWGFTDWPHDTPTFDLGNRVFDVIAIPGHHGTSIALYDRRTGVLLTGDSVYPGHLFIPSEEAWHMVATSLDRLVAFAAANPVSWVLGNHIEVSSRAREPYPYRTAAHPNERALHFAPTKLQEIADAVRAMGDTPRCEVHDYFVIQPTYLCGSGWNGEG
jgi:glyoxylase-like metal-dependent hydrolase (beta-lactamase superfamily II)